MVTTRSLFPCSLTRSFLSLTKTRARKALAIASALLLTISSFAQSLPTAPDSQPQNSTLATAGETATVTIPAGTNIALVLVHPIQSKYIHRGDDIYSQINSPVNVGNEVVIPPGSFVQGKVDKVENKSGRGVIHLQSLSLTFPNGFAANLLGPVTLESDDGYAIKDPGKGRILGAFIAPAAGLGLGALIGRAADNSPGTTLTTTLPPNCGVPTPGCTNGTTQSITAPPSHLKGIAIGSMVGLAIGGAISLALVLHSHNFYLDAGAPVEMTLQQPLTLEQDKVTGAVRQAEQHPIPEQQIAPRPQVPVPDNGTCYTPGTPGTPGIDIPGTPGTDGSPGTPGVHIPGTPPTAPTPYPCQ
jgi:hypothetical protein